jgi:sugar phosphate permease
MKTTKKPLLGKSLAWLLALIYFSSYVTRINFAAVLQEIITDTGYAKSQLSVILVALLVILGLGLAFGGFVFIGFILMSIYNAIASHTGWPLFTIWFWTAVAIALNWLMRGICVKCNNTDD